MNALQLQIIGLIYKALEGLGANIDTLAAVGSWGDTLEDEDVLAILSRHAICIAQEEGSREYCACEVCAGFKQLRFELLTMSQRSDKLEQAMNLSHQTATALQQEKTELRLKVVAMREALETIGWLTNSEDPKAFSEIRQITQDAL